jgi:hypothetical protein
MYNVMAWQQELLTSKDRPLLCLLRVVAEGSVAEGSRLHIVH